MRAAALREELAQVKLLTTSTGDMAATGAAAGIKVHWGAPVTAVRLGKVLAAARQTAAVDQTIPRVASPLFFWEAAEGAVIRGVAVVEAAEEDKAAVLFILLHLIVGTDWREWLVVLVALAAQAAQAAQAAGLLSFTRALLQPSQAEPS